MRGYSIIVLLLIFIITPEYCFPQRKYLVAGFWGFPTGSVFGYGNLEFEYQTKNNADAWQVSINMSAGAMATDVGTTNRKWITVDKLISFKKSFHQKYSFFYSLFTEIGDRKVTGGMRRNFQDLMLNKKEAFEVNPGIGWEQISGCLKKFICNLSAPQKSLSHFIKTNIMT